MGGFVQKRDKEWLGAGLGLGFWPEDCFRTRGIIMKVNIIQSRLPRRWQGGFSIMEIAVASAVIGIMFAALLTGLTSSVTNVQFGREQLRATQIMVEKLDTVRMYRWDRINSTYIPATFTETYDPTITQGTGPKQTTNSSGTANLTYAGTIQISDPALSESYASNVKQVTVALQWQSSGRPVQREMTTFVSKYGLQLYVP
jgi:Tfp pilus assembly protein PilV